MSPPMKLSEKEGPLVLSVPRIVSVRAAAPVCPRNAPRQRIASESAIIRVNSTAYR